jgi:hypothetical protein
MAAGERSIFDDRDLGAGGAEPDVGQGTGIEQLGRLGIGRRGPRGQGERSGAGEDCAASGR